MATDPQPANRTTDETHLFLLRVWLERGGFRAALRQVGGGAPSVFTQPAEVSAFLERLRQPSTDIEGNELEGSAR
jgi:hypothetical protein